MMNANPTATVLKRDECWALFPEFDSSKMVKCDGPLFQKQLVEIEGNTNSPYPTDIRQSTLNPGDIGIPDVKPFRESLYDRFFVHQAD